MLNEEQYERAAAQDRGVPPPAARPTGRPADEDPWEPLYPFNPPAADEAPKEDPRVRDPFYPDYRTSTIREIGPQEYALGQEKNRIEAARQQAEAAHNQALEAIKRGELAQALELAKQAAQLSYSTEMMKLAQKPEMAYRYLFARYGLNAPQGGSPTPLPIPDFVKPLLANPNATDATSFAQSAIPSSMQPALANLIPGAIAAPGGIPWGNRGLSPTSREMSQYPTQSIPPQVDLPRGDLAPGARGGDVALLQRQLERLGYLTPPPGMNYGFYGPLTTAAVARFQQDSGARGSPGMYTAAVGDAIKQWLIPQGPQNPNPYQTRQADSFGAEQPNPPPSMQLGGGQPQAPPASGFGMPWTQAFQQAQSQPQNLGPGPKATLPPAVQNLFALQGQPQSQIPITPPAGYNYPKLGNPSMQSLRYYSPGEMANVTGYADSIEGRPPGDFTKDIDRLAPQGAAPIPTRFS